MNPAIVLADPRILARVLAAFEEVDVRSSAHAFAGALMAVEGVDFFECAVTLAVSSLRLAARRSSLSPN
jgi:hypothetical protein